MPGKKYIVDTPFWANIWPNVEQVIIEEMNMEQWAKIREAYKTSDEHGNATALILRLKNSDGIPIFQPGERGKIKLELSLTAIQKLIKTMDGIDDLGGEGLPTRLIGLKE